MLEKQQIPHDIYLSMRNYLELQMERLLTHQSCSLIQSNETKADLGPSKLDLVSFMRRGS